VGKYLEWAADYQENQVTVIYDTMWDATREMADAIAKGVRAGAPGTTVKVLHVGHRDKNEIVTEIFKSRLVAAGCSTINRGLLSAMTGILEMVKGLSFRNKLGAAFGSYGWSGESVGLIEKWLAESGLTLAAEGLKINWRADAEGLARCEEFGRTLAARL
jgi:flavorubredoxin